MEENLSVTAKNRANKKAQLSKNLSFVDKTLFSAIKK